MRYLIVIVALAISSPLVALNMTFLKDSVFSKFSESELTSFLSKIRVSLDTTKDGEVIEWQSESGVFKGRMLPRATYYNGSTKCRRTVFKLAEGDRKPERYRFDLCLVEDQWRVSQTPITSFTNENWRYLRDVLRQVLETEEDANPTSWFFDKTKTSGTLTPLNTIKTGEQICRDVALSIISPKGQMTDGKYRFCKGPEGDWTRS
jgi:surface antigen